LIELSGNAIVATGSFNPAIFHPLWLKEKELIAENAAEDALAQIFVTPELTAFTADWLSVQVTLQQAIFSTVEEGREPELRDLFMGTFDLLPETPINAVGINADVHFRVESQEAWHGTGQVSPQRFLGANVFRWAMEEAAERGHRWAADDDPGGSA